MLNGLPSGAGVKVEHRVIGSLVNFMMGCDAPGAVINRMASPDTKIVSLTITKGDYNVKDLKFEFIFFCHSDRKSFARNDS